jgi:undecaprenyl-diphosphatase
MSILQAIILGIIQGLTEFLPISSSAHLVIAPFLFGWQLDPQVTFTFDVLVQDGTLLAVILYFWKDLWGILRAFVRGIFQGKPFADPQARLGWLLILATLPAGVIGLLFKSSIEAAFNSVAITAGFLFLTAVLLTAAEWFGRRSRNLAQLNWLDALVMGAFQALAVFPGISRSGSTISGGLLRQLDRTSAARFSFLMSVPVMLAAGALQTLDALSTPQTSAALPLVAVGFLAAAVVGFLSIRWLLGYLQKRSFYAFAIYCAALGALTLIVLAIRG